MKNRKSLFTPEEIGSKYSHIDYNKRMHWCAGKWFQKDGYEFEDNDIFGHWMDFREFLQENSRYNVEYFNLYNTYYKFIDSKSKFEKFIEMVQNYDKRNHSFDEWPAPNLVRKALKEEEEGKELQPLSSLPITITEEQLILMNVKLFRPKDERQILIINGVGGSGKSTFLNLVQQIYGDNDVSSLSLSDLSYTHSTTELCNCRLVCSTDIDADKNVTSANLKKLASKEKITVNPKGKDMYKGKCQATFIYSTNNEVLFDISDSGAERRVCYYFMNKAIKRSNFNLDLKDYRYTKEQLITFIRHIYRTKVDNDWFNVFKKDTAKFILENNKVYKFLQNNQNDLKLLETDYDNSLTMVFEDFEKFCQSKRYTIYGFDNFQKWIDIIIEKNDDDKLLGFGRYVNFGKKNKLATLTKTDEELLDTIF